MKFTKCFLAALFLVFVFNGIVFAGAPSPIIEKPVPVETVTPPPPPPPPAPEPVQPLVVSKHFTAGIGFGGSPLLGFVEKDQFDYPRVEYGLISGIGFGYTWFSGQPSAEQIRDAIASVKSKYGTVSDKDLPSMVRKELGITTLKYVELGILNAEMGTEWLLSDSVRTRFGFGLPTLISFGINFDF